VKPVENHFIGYNLLLFIEYEAYENVMKVTKYHKINKTDEELHIYMRRSVTIYEQS
jgi:hypothetical protein